MANVVMADSIAHLPEFKGWYSVIKDTVNDLDLGKILVYIIDSVDSSALPFLAEQFNVLGYKGYRLTQTDTDRRELLKRAIELHRYKGTEWAIKEALKSIGFTDIELIKSGYDHWAKFGIRITNKDLQLTDSAFNDILQMVSEYKRAVCVLAEVLINILVEDNLYVNDDQVLISQEIAADDQLLLSGATRYDGTHSFDGDINFSGDSDAADMDEN